jgi:hypothetical protein
MAEFGAHVTSKLEVSRASIFELLAQENLSIGLRSAFHYLINVSVPLCQSCDFSIDFKRATMQFAFTDTRRSKSGEIPERKELVR